MQEKLVRLARARPYSGQAVSDAEYTSRRQSFVSSSRLSPIEDEYVRHDDDEDGTKLLRSCADDIRDVLENKKVRLSLEVMENSGPDMAQLYVTFCHYDVVAFAIDDMSAVG